MGRSIADTPEPEKEVQKEEPTLKEIADMVYGVFLAVKDLEEQVKQWQKS